VRLPEGNALGVPNAPFINPYGVYFLLCKFKYVVRWETHPTEEYGNNSIII